MSRSSRASSPLRFFSASRSSPTRAPAVNARSVATVQCSDHGGYRYAQSGSAAASQPLDVSKLVSKALKRDENGEVIDKIKNRGVDSATENEINNAAQVTENIKLNSVDKNVTLIKKLLKIKKEAEISGWVVDESRAYRQIGIAPSHRRWSVICLFEPKTRKVMFFIMIGHSFGLVASVYNYNLSLIHI